MNALRLAFALALLATAATPAAAGNFTISRTPLNGMFVQADGCAHQKALDLLTHAQMQLVAEVPRTDALYRFVVKWKSDLFAVTIGTSDCKLNVVDYARRIKPYCSYVGEIVPACLPDEMAQ